MKGISESLLHPTLGTAGAVAVMGYLVVFFGLVLLLAVVTVMGRAMEPSRRKNARPAPGSPVPETAPPAERPAAKGTAGQLKLYNVSQRDAALIMAIVANQLQKPINELRFRSIKEVRDDEV